MTNNGSKLLIGIPNIIKHWDMSEYRFRQFLSMGMPAVIINGQWYVHVENVENWFKKITFSQVELEIPEVKNGLSKKGA